MAIGISFRNIQFISFVHFPTELPILLLGYVSTYTFPLCWQKCFSFVICHNDISYFYAVCFSLRYFWTLPLFLQVEMSLLSYNEFLYLDFILDSILLTYLLYFWAQAKIFSLLKLHYNMHWDYQVGELLHFLICLTLSHTYSPKGTFYQLESFNFFLNIVSHNH